MDSTATFSSPSITGPLSRWMASIAGSKREDRKARAESFTEVTPADRLPAETGSTINSIQKQRKSGRCCIWTSATMNSQI